MSKLYLVTGQLYGNLPASLYDRLTSKVVTPEEASKEIPAGFPLQTSSVLRGNIVTENTVIFVWEDGDTLRRYSFTPAPRSEAVVETPVVSEPDTNDGYW